MLVPKGPRQAFAEALVEGGYERRFLSPDVGVDVESGVEVIAAPVGGVPEAVAVLLTAPAFTSAWVSV